MPPAVMPTVGCIVHFCASSKAEPEAAMIVAVLSNRDVNLVVWDRMGVQRFEETVELADEPPADRSSWAWPPRV